MMCTGRDLERRGDMANPIVQRRRAESIRGVAETVVGRKHFTGWALVVACLFFVVAGRLPDGAGGS